MGFVETEQCQPRRRIIELGGTVERIKVMLLAGIFLVLLWIAFRPRHEIGRFVAPTGDANDDLLDTATGRMCVGYKTDSKAVPACSDLR